MVTMTFLMMKKVMEMMKIVTVISKVVDMMEIVTLISKVMDYMGKLGKQEMAREAVSQARGY